MLETDEAVTRSDPNAARRRAGDRIRVHALDAVRAQPPGPLPVRQVMVVAMIVFVATVLTIASGAHISYVRFAYFDCAVVAAAIYAGVPGGLFTILSGILVVAYTWLPPRGALSLGDPASVFALFGFAIGGLIVTALASRFRHQARQLTVARDAAVASDERLRLIAEAGRVLSSSLDYEITVARLARLAVPAFADGCAVDLVVDGHIERLAAAHENPEKLRLMRDNELHFRPALIDDGGIAAVIRTGEPQFAPIVTDAMLATIAKNPAHLAKLRGLEIRSAMIVPISTRGMILGALTLVISRPGRVFTDADFNTAQALGRRAALAIDNARLYRAARSANEVKTNFIATMSHELRTPLTAIIGFQELLADGLSGPVSDGQKVPLQRIKVSAMRLLELIEEILLFARLEAGTEIVHVERFQVKRVIDDVIAFASSTAAECGLTLRAEGVDPALDIDSDYAKVRQILIMLVSNALKFTAKGGLVVVRAVGPDDDVAIEIQDTGEGIEQADIPHIFDPFWQADQTRTRRSGGSGIGLSVARRLAQLLGGDISVESAPKVGSTFRVRLPRTAPRLA